MESTGKYWIPVYNILEPSCRITLAHPKYVKVICGKKTDKKDSIWIADLYKYSLVPGSFILPADIREIRDLALATVPNWFPLRPAKRTGCKTP